MSDLVLTLRDNPIIQMMHHIWSEIDPMYPRDEVTIGIYADWRTPDNALMLEVKLVDMQGNDNGGFEFQVSNAELLNVTRTANHVIETVKRKLADPDGAQ